MASNSFGHIFRLTSFGESHGYAIGGIVDGCPANEAINLELVQKELDRRKPGQSAIVTQRKESDTVQFLSGIYQGLTLGTPIGFIIPNENQKSEHYNHLENAFRPSHADFTYQEKYGIRDPRGGGRSSARETACRVVAGAIAKQLLHKKNIEIYSYVSSVRDISVDENYSTINLSAIDDNEVRCPDASTASQMIEAIKVARKNGDTLGGVITCIIKNCPIGLGAPVFDKLHADLGKAFFSINAVKGVEFGSGFASTLKKGSELNDLMRAENEKIHFESNNSGGIQGGISNGEDIVVRIAFKPVATIMQEQTSINDKGENIVLEGKGRHDPCVLPRAVPIVDAMAAMVILDHYLLNKTVRI